MLSRRLLNCGCRNGNCEMKVCILNVLTLRILAGADPRKVRACMLQGSGVTALALGRLPVLSKEKGVFKPTVES